LFSRKLFVLSCAIYSTTLNVRHALKVIYLYGIDTFYKFPVVNEKIYFTITNFSIKLSGMVAIAHKKMNDKRIFFSLDWNVCFS